jgi:hypothetical protein
VPFTKPLTVVVVPDPVAVLEDVPLCVKVQPVAGRSDKFILPKIASQLGIDTAPTVGEAGEGFTVSTTIGLEVAV